MPHLHGCMHGFHTLQEALCRSNKAFSVGIAGYVKEEALGVPAIVQRGRGDVTVPCLLWVVMKRLKGAAPTQVAERNTARTAHLVALRIEEGLNAILHATASIHLLTPVDRSIHCLHAGHNWAFRLSHNALAPDCLTVPHHWETSSHVAGLHCGGQGKSVSCARGSGMECRHSLMSVCCSALATSAEAVARRALQREFSRRPADHKAAARPLAVREARAAGYECTDTMLAVAGKRRQGGDGGGSAIQAIVFRRHSRLGRLCTKVPRVCVRARCSGSSSSGSTGNDAVRVGRRAGSLMRTASLVWAFFCARLGRVQFDGPRRRAWQGRQKALKDASPDALMAAVLGAVCTKDDLLRGSFRDTRLSSGFGGVR